MNYEDEEYVRFYVRETVGWMALGWEGQCVLSLMLHGKFDRAGVFDCDGHEPSHAVTLVTRMPTAVVEDGLKRLLASGTWVHRDGKLVWPKFIEAQTCRRSDRARQRESRQIRRNAAIGQPVTPGDGQSQPVTRELEPVTPGDGQSQPVTQSRAEQSRAENSPTPLEPVTGQADVRPEPVKPRRADPMAHFAGQDPAQRPDVIKLHAAWREQFRLAGHKLRLAADNPEAEAAVLARALDDHGIETCLLVLEHAANDGMVSGREDERRQKHESIAYIFGNAQAFARILRSAEEAKKAASGTNASDMVARMKAR